MSRKEIIEKKLSVLNPHILKVIDNSAAHAGHAGNPNNDGETHFEIQISSTQLDNLTKIKQHRIINNALKDEFASGLHALSIKIIAKI
ncbi:MAG: BolA family transcriptional regulator [Rickettsiaceae bacterium]|nr:BolA family transcriptional regulator [Rickettsiaceae bacterium]MDP5021152.1 BolA family transcriptional regulator [Rickettsiaceae bacterium]MDP5083403.1 BolA family transcriptional regulator [Rickettsiaceae bacterium]